MAGDQKTISQRELQLLRFFEWLEVDYNCSVQDHMIGLTRWSFGNGESKLSRQRPEELIKMFLEMQAAKFTGVCNNGRPRLSKEECRQNRSAAMKLAWVRRKAASAKGEPSPDVAVTTSPVREAMDRLNWGDAIEAQRSEKKRGRPRKYPVVEQPQPKRGRGRPRKVVA